ncbi:MAG: amidohydrolase [Eubacteriales bacterium]|nr:amidohydrolase [Eubacteriales bacterium]
MKERIHAKIESIAPELTELAKWLYAHPEIANEEFESSRKVMDFLEQAGFTVTPNLAGLPTAFRAVRKNGEGPKVAIMAEYDALPGLGHGCGHHLIAAMGAGAGIALSGVLSDLPGEVAVFGTPAEETGDGKSALAKAGMFDEYDIGIMLHPCSVHYTSPVILAISAYDFTFTGRASHAGARPYEGINALDAVVSMYNAVGLMRQQLKDGTRVAGIVVRGGDVTNVIPDCCVVRYEVRAKQLAYFDTVVEKLVNCAKGAALATGCSMEYAQCEPLCMPLEESPLLAAEYHKLLDEYGLFEEGEDVIGSTDMGDVGAVIPSLHPFVKVSSNFELPHTEEFLRAVNEPFAYEQMLLGTELLARLGLTVFEDAELLDRLRVEKAKKLVHRKV